jgi:uncharacterized protein involved in propanediol utilization
MKYATKIYSRIGELMQGFLPDASGFLISGLPSRLFFSEAILTPDLTNLSPPGKPTGAALLPPKTQQALAAFRQAYDPDSRGNRFSIRLFSNIAPGKGLSSSSTDILSVLHVVNDYCQTGCSTEDLYHIAAGIEPTDPCLSEDIVVFRQNAGSVDRSISLPPMDIIYFDAAPDREIDTLQVQRTWTPGTGKYFDWLLQQFLIAAAIGDYDTLFDSITHSAEYNQATIALPRFDEYLQLARQTRSGLMVAHSGTIVGLLTRPEETKELRTRLETATAEPIYSEQYPSSLLNL